MNTIHCNDFIYVYLIVYFDVHEQSAVENLFSTYVSSYGPDGLFWLNDLNLYMQQIGVILCKMC